MVATHLLPVDTLRDVEVRDNGEQMVDLRIVCPEIDFEIGEYLLGAENGLAEYEAAHFARESVAEMLSNAQISLPEGYKLLIRCGYRTPEVQTREYEKDYAKLKLEFPDWSKEQLDTEIENRWASVDIAPHCTGGAIDLTIIDKHGEKLDMGTSMGDHGKSTHTYSNEILADQKVNRIMLLKVMEGVGFINFPGEWWHFSYGAREWAAYTGNEDSFYGNIEILETVN